MGDGKGLDPKNVWSGSMGDGKGLNAKNTRVRVVGWEMARGWMQRTCEVVG